MKVLVVSDTHFHNWTQFSHIKENGVNSRLENDLTEFARICDEAKAEGCEGLIHCGDLFHVKGKIETSVLTPVLTRIETEVTKNFPYSMFLTGNHDIAFSDSYKWAGNSLMIGNWLAQRSVLAGMRSHTLPLDKSLGELCTELEPFPRETLFLAWHKNIDEWKKAFSNFSYLKRIKFVFTHAPIDGVVPGVPEGGITQNFLDSIGFKGKIFAGHYHNHKEVSPQLISVGAFTHHSWSDVGSKAGYLIVDTDSGDYEFRETKTPKFVDLDTIKVASAEEYSAFCAGNYVRLTVEGELEKAKQIQDEIKEVLGAKAVLVNLKAKKPETVRASALGEITSNPLEKTISNYLDEVYKGHPLLEKIKGDALSLFSTVGE